MVYSSKIITSIFEKQILFSFTLIHRSEGSNGHCKTLGKRDETAEGNCCPFSLYEFPGRQERRSSSGTLLLSSIRSFPLSCKHLNETAASPKSLQSLFQIQLALSQVVFTRRATEKRKFWETSKGSFGSAASRGRAVNITAGTSTSLLGRQSCLKSFIINSQLSLYKMSRFFGFCVLFFFCVFL